MVINLQDQLFFDNDLTYDHLMFILNYGDTIENKFLDILFDQINDLNLDENIRGQLITNIYLFSSRFLPVNIHTNINRRYFNYNSTEINQHEYENNNNNNSNWN
ncbi:unnamed protein product [Rotaria sordida]|uniref:Uncharacterized protein n=1 Tax=Rotaria sordida TaxID=392033 RepID=A0A815HDK7_9BILA|nr:unnamed protein product [Rotaria sordida]CAF1601695.1 unnamed protein product [Rotaria sordida]